MVPSSIAVAMRRRHVLPVWVNPWVGRRKIVGKRWRAVPLNNVCNLPENAVRFRTTLAFHTRTIHGVAPYQLQFVRRKHDIVRNNLPCSKTPRKFV